MKLKLLSIKNWKEIKNLDIHFENLMLFLGQNTDGISSIFSALSFAFNKTKLENEYILNKEIPTKIKLIFYNDESVHKLKILIETNGNILYSLKTSEEKWKDLTLDEYIEFISSIPFIHINKLLKNEFKEVYKFFYNLLDSSSDNTENIKSHLENYYSSFESTPSDQELYRYLFFEFIKKIATDCLEKPSTPLGNAIILFEDPELYLYPQKERELYNYFIKLSNRGASIYLKTSSSCFLGLKQYKSICIIKKVDNEVTPFQTNKNIFRGDEIKAFNMNYWINPDRAELFFAKKVILVEGQTDKIVISYLAKSLGIFKYDYSIIECGSKSTIPQFISLLNSFNIPYTAIYDKDNHHWRTPEEIENSNIKNKSINSMINKTFGSLIVFDNDIEEEVYNTKRDRVAYKNKPFNALKYVSEDDFVLSDSLKEKILKIYE